ncbi:hypothetical protein AWZ03_002699, partial [Drosophila navojoa]
FAVNATCYLKAINWNKAVAHMDCDLVLPLANTSVHIELFKRDYSNRYHPFLVNAVVNVCDIISKRNFLTYGMMFWKVIKKYTNVNHSCPIKGAEPKIIFKTTNVECSGNPKRVVNISCIVKAVNWNKAVAQMDCDLVVPMRNFSVQFAVFKKGYNNQYHPFLVNVTFNACDILAKRSFLPYGTLMLKTIKDYSNVNHACPIEVLRH